MSQLDMMSGRVIAGGAYGAKGCFYASVDRKGVRARWGGIQRRRRAANYSTIATLPRASKAMNM